MIEWISLLITASFVTFSSWIAYKMIKALEKSKKEFKRKHDDEKFMIEFWEKITKNSLEFKIISQHKRTGTSVYEAMYKGYRLCIEERKEKTEYWIDHIRKGLILRNIHVNKEGSRSWIKYKTNQSQREYIEFQFQKNKKNWEQKKWKTNVIKASKTFYPALNEALKTSKTLDNSIQKELEKLIPFYIKMYMMDNQLTEKERKKLLEKIPKNVENMIKEYEQLEKKYREKEKENMKKYLKQVAKQYGKEKEEKQEEVFLKIRSE